MPDPAVVHVSCNDHTYQQACEFKQLFESEIGRQQMVDWLIQNDPFVHAAYSIARRCNAAGPDIDKAVIILLANAYRPMQRAKH